MILSPKFKWHAVELLLGDSRTSKWIRRTIALGVTALGIYAGRKLL